MQPSVGSVVAPFGGNRAEEVGIPRPHSNLFLTVSDSFLSPLLPLTTLTVIITMVNTNFLSFLCVRCFARPVLCVLSSSPALVENAPSTEEKTGDQKC